MIKRLAAIVLVFLIVLTLPGHCAGPVEVYFSPDGGCAVKVVSEIGRAEECVYIAMYYFTHQNIAWAVIGAQDRGVEVKVLLDKSQYRQETSKARFLMERGIQVRFHNHNGLMHNKFCVIDGEKVLTGSFNWTKAADTKNDENLLIISDAETARIFEERFWRLWKKGSLVPEGGD